MLTIWIQLRRHCLARVFFYFDIFVFIKLSVVQDWFEAHCVNQIAIERPPRRHYAVCNIDN